MTNQTADHSATVPAYRAYLIGASGRVASAVDILADTDEDAIRQAEAVEYRGPVELWDRSRVIFRHGEGERGQNRQ